jgi:hypothetical protein
MFRANARKRLISRISLVVVLSIFLGLALTFVATPSTPLAHAATRIANNTYMGPGTNVYDSAGHLEGYLVVEYSTDAPAVWGAFISNNNRWRSITVYIEYTNVYGFLDSSYGWAANTTFYSPAYYGYNCYYAEIDLYDQNYVDNWYGTGNYCGG